MFRYSSRYDSTSPAIALGMTEQVPLQLSCRYSSRDNSTSPATALGMTRQASAMRRRHGMRRAEQVPRA
ncbi:hypothetical protein RRG08_044425 [Elysia crispata]|uniref:Uncharacterized protein n=1 Tax=Elysia crispata TaxID=231223 RepID=A0AAE0YMT1_9GAST|nr:hypothetical protein RRG08_044425 [Elysia crispata]